MVSVPPTANAQWRILRPSSRWGAPINLRELWSYRELGLMLARRDLQLRYRQTLFGIAWAVLQPAIGVLAFSIIFGDLADVPSDGLPYPVFVITGLAVWFFISSAVGAAAESLVEHRTLVTEIWFPRILAPLAAVLALTLDLVIGLLLVVPFLIGYDVTPPLQVLTLPIWLAAAVLVAAAAGIWLCAANVLYRDVRYALNFLLQVWLFVSPIVFPSSLVDGFWSYVFALNPVAGVVDGTRWALLDGPAPGPELAVSAVSLLLMLAAGAVFFRSAERTFADRI
jgi:lipopolysaccharide transport system permease protein